MSNPYYNYSGNFLAGGLARAENVASEFTNVQAGFNNLSYQGTDSGSSNAYVVTTPYSPQTAYSDGNNAEFKAANGNTGASTINVNGIGSAPLLRGTGSALQGGDIIAGVWYLLTYSSTFSGWLVSSPASYTSFSGTISSAPPTHKVGLTAAAGSSTAAAPIDATYAIDQSIAPTWSGLHTFTDGLTVSSGTTTVQALTSATGITVATGGLTVSAGTTAVQALTATTVTTSATGSSLAGAVTITAPGSGASLSITGSTNTTVYGLIQNTNTGANASSLIAVYNSSYTGFLQMQGTGMSPGQLTNGVTGSALNLNTGGAFPIQFGINSVLAGTIGTSGQWTIPAPTSGNAITASGVASYYAGFFYGSSTTGQSKGLLIEAGTNASDFALNVANQAASYSLLTVYGDGHGTLGYNGTTSTIQFAASGAVSIAAPSSGAALALAGSASAPALSLTASSTTGSSNGIATNAGTNAADYNLQLYNQAGSALLAKLYGDGHGVLGYNGTTNTISWNAAGAVTIATPSSGAALTIAGGGITISAGGLTVTAGGITVNGGAATFNAGLAATGATITGAGSNAPLTIVNGGTNSECLNIGNQYYGTGSQTATFSATNKPGSGTTGPTQWLFIQLNGANYLIPCWQ